MSKVQWEAQGGGELGGCVILIDGGAIGKEKLEFFRHSCIQCVVVTVYSCVT